MTATTNVYAPYHTKVPNLPKVSLAHKASLEHRGHKDPEVMMVLQVGQVAQVETANEVKPVPKVMLVSRVETEVPDATVNPEDPVLKGHLVMTVIEVSQAAMERARPDKMGNQENLEDLAKTAEKVKEGPKESLVIQVNAEMLVHPVNPEIQDEMGLLGHPELMDAHRRVHPEFVVHLDCKEMTVLMEYPVTTEHLVKMASLANLGQLASPDLEDKKVNAAHPELKVKKANVVNMDRTA